MLCNYIEGVYLLSDGKIFTHRFAFVNFWTGPKTWWFPAGYYVNSPWEIMPILSVPLEIIIAESVINIVDIADRGMYV